MEMNVHDKEATHIAARLIVLGLTLAYAGSTGVFPTCMSIEVIAAYFVVRT